MPTLLLLPPSGILFEILRIVRLCCSIDIHIWGRITQNAFVAPLVNFQKFVTLLSFLKNISQPYVVRVLFQPPSPPPAAIVDNSLKYTFKSVFVCITGQSPIKANDSLSLEWPCTKTDMKRLYSWKKSNVSCISTSYDYVVWVFHQKLVKQKNTLGAWSHTLLLEFGLKHQ